MSPSRWNSEEARSRLPFWRRRNDSWRIIVHTVSWSAVGQRQREGDRRSLLRRAGHCQRAPMKSGDAASNREAQASPSSLARAGLVHAVEAFGQVREVLGCNADSRVAQLHECLFIFHRCAHNDTTTAPVVFDGVAE